MAALALERRLGEGDGASRRDRPGAPRPRANPLDDHGRRPDREGRPLRPDVPRGRRSGWPDDRHEAHAAGRDHRAGAASRRFGRSARSSTRSPSSGAGGACRAATRAANRAPGPGWRSPRSATSPSGRLPDGKRDPQGSIPVSPARPVLRAPTGPAATRPTTSLAVPVARPRRRHHHAPCSPVRPPDDFGYRPARGQGRGARRFPPRGRSARILPSTSELRRCLLAPEPVSDRVQDGSRHHAGRRILRRGRETLTHGPMTWPLQAVPSHWRTQPRRECGRPICGSSGSPSL